MRSRPEALRNPRIAARQAAAAVLLATAAVLQALGTSPARAAAAESSGATAPRGPRRAARSAPQRPAATKPRDRAHPERASRAPAAPPGGAARPSPAATPTRDAQRRPAAPRWTQPYGQPPTRTPAAAPTAPSDALPPPPEAPDAAPGRARSRAPNTRRPKAPWGATSPAAPPRRAPLRLARQHRPQPPERRWHLRVLGRSLSLLVPDGSLDALHSGDLVRRGGATAAVTLRAAGALWLGAEVGYAGGREQGDAYRDYTTELLHQSAELGVWVGYRLWDALTPYVRAGLSVTWVQTRLSGPRVTLKGEDVAAGGYALAGVELTIPRRWLGGRGVFRDTTFGLLLEAGFVDLGRFTLDGGRSEEGLVDEYRAPLGTLRLRGGTVDVGLLLRF